MDIIKENQGTKEQRKVYNLLKANPELADQLLKLFEDAYDQLMDGYIEIVQDFIKGNPSEEDTANLLADFLCGTMEEDMDWPNLIALDYQKAIITETQREAWIQEISSINKGYWEDGHKFDKFGNQLD